MSEEAQVVWTGRLSAYLTARVVAVRPKGSSWTLKIEQRSADALGGEIWIPLDESIASSEFVLRSMVIDMLTKDRLVPEQFRRTVEREEA